MSDSIPWASEEFRLRTCGQHPTLGDVTQHGSRACGRLLSVVDLYRCANCQTAFCRDCIRRHFADETPEAREISRKSEEAAWLDGDSGLCEESDDDV
jgi:hypothetical protein